jgi:4-amino-4-deoxy-L-arabinose transferase-like glycosyltransferase
MAFSRFEVGLAWRTVVLVLAVWLLVEASAAAHLRAGRLVAALIAFAALANLWAFIRRTNFQVARFIESVRFEDYSQRFSDPSGGGFDVLGETLDHALKGLQESPFCRSCPFRRRSVLSRLPRRPTLCGS